MKRICRWECQWLEKMSEIFWRFQANGLKPDYHVCFSFRFSHLSHFVYFHQIIKKISSSVWCKSKTSINRHFKRKKIKKSSFNARNMFRVKKAFHGISSHLKALFMYIYVYVYVCIVCSYCSSNVKISNFISLYGEKYLTFSL